jgi:hypothetical protein
MDGKSADLAPHFWAQVGLSKVWLLSHQRDASSILMTNKVAFILGCMHIVQRVKFCSKNRLLIAAA